MMMYGRSHSFSQLTHDNAFDSSTYPGHLTAKLAELRDFVESELAAAGHNYKTNYDKHIRTRSFVSGDPVWLSIPTAGKLDPRWEGRWVVKAIKSPENIEIMNGRTLRVVHVNRVLHRFAPPATSAHATMDRNEAVQVPEQWTPPTVDHLWISSRIPSPPCPAMPRFPRRTRKPPDRFGW